MESSLIAPVEPIAQDIFVNEGEVIGLVVCLRNEVVLVAVK